MPHPWTKKIKKDVIWIVEKSYIDNSAGVFV